LKQTLDSGMVCYFAKLKFYLILCFRLLNQLVCLFWNKFQLNQKSRAISLLVNFWEPIVY